MKGTTAIKCWIKKILSQQKSFKNEGDVTLSDKNKSWEKSSTVTTRMPMKSWREMTTDGNKDLRKNE